MAGTIIRITADCGYNKQIRIKTHDGQEDAIIQHGTTHRVALTDKSLLGISEEPAGTKNSEPKLRVAE